MLKLQVGSSKKVGDPTAPTITRASALIDELKSDSGGNGLALHQGSL